MDKYILLTNDYLVFMNGGKRYTSSQENMGQTSDQIINTFARWKKDEVVDHCSNCKCEFNFLNRKHHCRCCGDIFCGSCSNNFGYYDKDKVKVVQRSENDVESSPYRTCQACYDNLVKLHLLEDISEDIHSSIISKTRVNQTCEGQSEISLCNSNSENIMDDIHIVHEELLTCPVCNRNYKVTDANSSELHIQACIKQAEQAQQHLNISKEFPFQNRMLVYVVPKETISSDIYPECLICFEEMEPGQKIGRLECLCAYHYECIKSWLHKKSRDIINSNRTHSNISKLIEINFCPLHDAIF